MIEVLSKPIDEIGPAEIQSLIDSEVPEGEQMEFKKEPPEEEGKSDPWMGGGKIGTYAKKRILKEVVAFANAYGGVLVIGIDESDTKPAVATKITPVPRCEDLAESLKLVFRDRVEPQLARIDIAGVQTEDDGAGVVVIRVGKSRLAPHRVTRTLICPIRRADRSEEMTMREIQDMTLNVSRGLERLEKRLSERSERFQEEFSRIERHDNLFGLRLTAVPVVEEIRFNRVFQQGRITQELDTPWRKVSRPTDNGERTLGAPPGFPPLFWQPLLRGARAECYASNTSYLPSETGYRELYCDGLVEFGFVSIADEAGRCLDPDWPIVLFANLAAWVDHVRNEARAPNLEYALEVETRNVGNAGFVRKSGGLWIAHHHTPPRLRNAKFPTYPLNDSEEIVVLLARFYRDFWNAMQEDVGEMGFILT